MTNDELSTTAVARAPLWGQRDFLLLWLGQTASTFGDRLHQIALLWWTIQLTGSVAQSALVMIATTLPAVLVSPIAGVLADRGDRRALMIGTDLLRALLALGLGALALTGQLSFPVLLVASTLLAVLTALFTPANMATLPAVVEAEDLVAANSLMGATLNAASLLGPALGGLFVAACGAGAAFGLNGATFLLSAALIAALRFVPPPAAAGESFAASLRGGFAVLGEQPLIGRLLFGFAALNFFTMPVLMFLPYFAKEAFGVGAFGLGALEAAVAGGMLLASLAWARAGAVGHRRAAMAGSVGAAALCYLAMGTWATFGGYLAALAGAGAAIASLNVVVMAFFQARVPAAQMGRFMGLLTAVVSGLIPLSYGLYGALGSWVDPPRLLFANGVAIAAVALWLGRLSGLDEA